MTKLLHTPVLSQVMQQWLKSIHKAIRILKQPFTVVVPQKRVITLPIHTKHDRL